MFVGVETLVAGSHNDMLPNMLRVRVPQYLQKKEALADFMHNHPALRASLVVEADEASIKSPFSPMNSP
eukprot:4258283-Pyramimonas_sp.AAC.1